MNTIEQVRRDMDRLRGRLFSFTEAIGLPQSQEDGMKATIRTITYDAQRELESTLRASERHG